MDETLLKRFDVPGPRYTSYPTADRFVEAFGPAEALQALRQRAEGVGSSSALSLYVHVPFCESVCYYCACNKVITKHHERATEYLDESVKTLVDATRQIGFASINVDLIYGLPRQTEAGFARTVAQVCGLKPDRIALYAYAHLPQRFKPQRRIDAAQLPTAAARVAMLGNAVAGFLAQGYTYIGMDHFALPDDALTVAKRQGRLHRNFQGYSTQPDCDLVALGVSAIGRIGATYSQNAKTLPEYCDALRHGHLPVVRGIALTRDDLLRRAVIMALMCQGRVEFESIELAHLVSMRSYFAEELERLAPFVEAGLVVVEPNAIQVTAAGWYVVRAVAMVFDRHVHLDRQRERFSRVI